MDGTNPTSRPRINLRGYKKTNLAEVAALSPMGNHLSQRRAANHSNRPSQISGSPIFRLGKVLGCRSANRDRST